LLDESVEFKVGCEQIAAKWVKLEQLDFLRVFVRLLRSALPRRNRQQVICSVEASIEQRTQFR
jgi:hypothetical protein